MCTGKAEIFRGACRYTARHIDRGHVPEGFVPVRRASKPAPKYYTAVEPQPYSDFTQADFFTKNDIPDCLKNNTFVVFDLETTGLNSSPSGGNMDRIIEIGAYKIIGGEIKESFSTFVNPGRKLSEEIIKLTGITQEMVEDAPTYEKVMPDFFKFCQGSYLVGHNAAGFDFKFVDYYCSQLGYHLERKIFDTIPLSQEYYLAGTVYNPQHMAVRDDVSFTEIEGEEDEYEPLAAIYYVFGDLVDVTVEAVKRIVAKLREMSPLYEDFMKKNAKR